MVALNTFEFQFILEYSSRIFTKFRKFLNLKYIFNFCPFVFIFLHFKNFLRILRLVG